MHEEHRANPEVQEEENREKTQKKTKQQNNCKRESEQRKEESEQRKEGRESLDVSYAFMVKMPTSQNQKKHEFITIIHIHQPCYRGSHNNKIYIQI